MTPGVVDTRTGGVTRALTGDHGLGSRMVFEAAETGETSDIGMSASAHRCGECQTVVVPGSASDAFACFECQADIPADAAACPKCGWTW